jgi:hypothetical protein
VPIEFGPTKTLKILNKKKLSKSLRLVLNRQIRPDPRFSVKSLSCYCDISVLSNMNTTSYFSLSHRDGIFQMMVLKKSTNNFRGGKYWSQFNVTSPETLHCWQKELLWLHKYWHITCNNQMSTLCIVLDVPKYRMPSTFKQHKLHLKHFSRKLKRKYCRSHICTYTQQIFDQKNDYMKHQVLSNKYLTQLKKLIPWITDTFVRLKMWVANLQKHSNHLSKA